jgi:septal ring factor EnvC (AmiA/AmiB activator)
MPDINISEATGVAIRLYDKRIANLESENAQLSAELADCEAENNHLRADLAETEAELAALRGQLAEIIGVLRKELPSKKWGWSDEL